MNPNRTLWACDRILSRRGLDGRRPVDTLEEAVLVSSLCKSGLHAPALDIDWPASLEVDDHLPMAREKGWGRGAWIVTIKMPGFVSMRDPPWFALAERLARLSFCDSVRARPRVVGEETAFTAQEWETSVDFFFKNPVELGASSHAQHFHLYLEKEIPWSEYHLVLRMMEECRLLQHGFVDNSIERGQTMLLKPGLKKADLDSVGVSVETY